MDQEVRSSPPIPASIWTLGFVSLLMDASSELIHSLLPIFMVTALGASASAVGLIEGAAEASTLIIKVFSGTLSDYWGRRKELVVFGYSLATLSKPLFALSTSISWVFTARFLDRIGKGIREAPRDALIADLAPASIRGAAYGLRQALDTVGAFAGPLLAIWLMLKWSGDFRAVFWFATLPAVLAVLLLLAGIREPASSSTRPKVPIEWRKLKQLHKDYWKVTALGATFTLARFSEAFLVLRARQAGLPNAFAPAVYVLMNVVYAATAYPVGRMADRFDRRRLLLGGILALIASHLALARSCGLPLAAVGMGLWGLHLGLTQGLFSAMIADAAPAGLRGTAFGVFNLMSGIAVLASSGLAGILWDSFGFQMTFYAGAFFSGASLIFLTVI